MSLSDWSRVRLLFTALFSLLLVSGLFLLVVDARGARGQPSQYLFVALDAVAVAILVFRPDLLPDSLT